MNSFIYDSRFLFSKMTYSSVWELVANRTYFDYDVPEGHMVTLNRKNLQDFYSSLRRKGVEVQSHTVLPICGVLPGEIVIGHDLMVVGAGWDLAARLVKDRTGTHIRVIHTEHIIPGKVTKKVLEETLQEFIVPIPEVSGERAHQE